jgi:hypothetical protein
MRWVFFYETNFVVALRITENLAGCDSKTPHFKYPNILSCVSVSCTSSEDFIVKLVCFVVKRLSIFCHFILRCEDFCI